MAKAPGLTIMDTPSEANGTFALYFLKKLGENNSKNMFFLPMSISSSLALVFMGEKRNTIAQMVQACSLSKSGDRGEDLPGFPVTSHPGQQD